MTTALTVIVILDIREAEAIKFHGVAAAGDVDREEDRPCDRASHQADHHGDLEESQEEVSIESVVIQDPCVGDLVELS